MDEREDEDGDPADRPRDDRRRPCRGESSLRAEQPARADDRPFGRPDQPDEPDLPSQSRAGWDDRGLCGGCDGVSACRAPNQDRQGGIPCRHGYRPSAAPAGRNPPVRAGAKRRRLGSSGPSGQLPGYVPSVTCKVDFVPLWLLTTTGTFPPGFSPASTVVSMLAVEICWPSTETIVSPARIPAFAAGPPALTEPTRTPFPLVSPALMPR